MVRHIAEHEFVKKVRYVNEMTIYFATKDEIFVSNGKTHVLFERWFDGRNVYTKRWRPFVQILTHKKNLDSVYEIWRIARKYEVCAHTAHRFPNIPNEVKEIEN